MSRPSKDLWDPTKCTDICIVRVLRREEKKGQKRMFEEVMPPTA
jgi:hypothetical protein